MWHASVAVLNMKHRKTLRTAEHNDRQRRVAIRSAKTLLLGVGQMPSLVEQFEYAIHYRKAITDTEWQGLPQAWCNIPAVHEAGSGIVLERNT